MKYFIASKWSNMKAVQLLTENLQTLGHEVFSFVPDKRNFVSAAEIDRGPGGLLDPAGNWHKNTELKQMFDKDMAGLTESDVCILLLPAGKDAHLQAGIAYGFNKHMVLIGQPESIEVHYQIFDEWHKTVDGYLASLRTAGSK